MTLPLMDRITDALQREHDLIQELRVLGSEFVDTMDRLSEINTRLQARFERGKVVHLPKVEPPGGDDFAMPNVLKDGPTKRG